MHRVPWLGAAINGKVLTNWRNNYTVIKLEFLQDKFLKQGSYIFGNKSHGKQIYPAVLSQVKVIQWNDQLCALSYL